MLAFLTATSYTSSFFSENAFRDPFSCANALTVLTLEICDSATELAAAFAFWNKLCMSRFFPEYAGPVRMPGTRSAIDTRVVYQDMKNMMRSTATKKMPS